MPPFSSSSSSCYSHRHLEDVHEDSFRVHYRISAHSRPDALSIVDELRYEQTVELPEHLVPRDSWIGRNVVGEIVALEEEAGEGGEAGKGRKSGGAVGKDKKTRFVAKVTYRIETSGKELPQLINVVFGNTSIKENVMVIDVEFGKNVESSFRGPRFGVLGLRKLLNVKYGPLLCTALKPMGTSADELAEMAFAFALGGIDIIKDDHGLANQVYAPFEERVTKCAQAVRRANDITGRNCLYAPCLNAPAHLVLKRAEFAKRVGCGAVLVLPGITGLDACRALSEDENFNLPIIAHPAISGAMLGGGSKNEVRGFSHGVLLGLLPRLAGCDATIFPNFGGRFGFSKDECKDIQNACTSILGTKPAIFPSPGGGMTLEKIKSIRQFYGGQDVLLLIGGSLYSYSNDLTANARHFLQMSGRIDAYGPNERPIDGSNHDSTASLRSPPPQGRSEWSSPITSISNRETTRSRFETIFAASPAHLKQRQSPSPSPLCDDKTQVTPTKQKNRYDDDDHDQRNLLQKTPSHHAPMSPSSSEVDELREKNAALEKKLDELTSLVAKLANSAADAKSSAAKHRRATDGPLEGNHSKVLIKKDKKFMWNRVEREMYKMDGGSFKGCSRVELIGKRGESTNFHVRYFEVAPGGWTTLEHHQHEHVVVIVRGSGYIQLGSEAYAMQVGDVGYTAPGDIHQLRCTEEATDNFGFICIVSAERDRPIEVDASEHLKYCEHVSGPHLEDTIRKSLQAQVKHRAAQKKLKNPDGSYAEGSACEWRPPGKK